MLLVCEKPCVVDGWMDGRMGGWMDGWESGVKDCLQQSKKAWLLNGWVDEWMGGIKLKYNGGPFSKNGQMFINQVSNYIKIKL